MIRAIAIDDEPLALDVIRSLCQRTEGIALEKTFTRPNEALKHLAKFPVDLIFCDIQMPAMTGISLVKALPQDCMVIFTTAFGEYAVTSYELNAIDYLLKPINFKRFSQAIDKVREHRGYLNNRDSRKEITVRADFSLIRIPLADIQYVVGLADYLQIHVQGRKTITVRMSMKEMMDKLDSKEFVRIHRSFIVPLGDILAVKGSMLVTSSREFPVGRTYMADFMERYTK